MDFNYVDSNGSTIFKMCFDRYLLAINTGNKHGELSKMVGEIENVFFWLIGEAQKRHTEQEIKSILEKTDNSGQAVIIPASKMSERILTKLLQWNVRTNNVDQQFSTPEFMFKKCTKKMMKLGLNPKVIRYDGYSELNNIHPNSFKTKELSEMASKFEDSIYYSTEDQKCKGGCPSDCPAKMDGFYFKNGKFPKCDKRNRIGQGGAAKVFNPCTEDGAYMHHRVVF